MVVLLDVGNAVASASCTRRVACPIARASSVKWSVRVATSQASSASVR